MRRNSIFKTLQLLIALVVATGVMLGAPQKKARHKRTIAKARVSRAAAPRKAVARHRAIGAKYQAARPVAVTTRSSRLARARRRVAWSQWTEPTFADSTTGDKVDGEDLTVRRAAVEALGPYNGTVVVVDSTNGRVLSMVNQKLALKSGFQPCSTVKVSVALAALSEGLISRETKFRLASRNRMDLTYALAHSNNLYFANLGVKLGYDRYSYYARLFGFGEKAGLGIDGEEPGYFPAEPPKNGGMGMLTSFGEEIQLTPLELAAMMSAISNGGTLYYLQYPKSSQEAEQFVPRVKRHLDIARFIPEVKPGMKGAVEFGTARRALYSPESTLCGKTGTCTERTTHLGWFGSFNDFGQKKLVVVVLLTGGHGVSGPTASGVAGNVYRKLDDQGYFAKPPVFSPAVLVPR